MLGFCFVLTLLSATIHAYPNTVDSHHQRQASSPCSALANAQAAFFAGHPDDTVAKIPANLMYNCLTGVPVQKIFSTRLVNNVRAWFEFRSEVNYTASPPPGSLWKPLNLFTFLDDIADDVLQDRYKNQYEIELDLLTFALHFHDCHTLVSPGLFKSGTSHRDIHLTSYSADGIEEPKVYLRKDVLVKTATRFELAAKDINISPVTTINGIPVQKFLQTQALWAFSHDLDTMYNELFSSISLTLNPLGPKSNYFTIPLFYPGPETIVKREDGTGVSRRAFSSVSCNLSQITSGYDFWRICVFEPEAAAGAGARAGASAIEWIATSSATASGKGYKRAESTAGKRMSRRLRGHPEPEVVDTDKSLSGYFLEGYEDVAVLVIRSFKGTSPGYLESFQDTLELCLEHAQGHNKTKLIIDFQGNSGGYVDASTELMAQLFPNVPPDQKNNMRASMSMQLILEKEGRSYNHTLTGADVEEVLREEEGGYYAAWQALMKPDVSEFVSFEDSYDPYDLHEKGNYTQFFQGNYTNSDPSELSQASIQITGYGNRWRAPNTPPLFNASNIVILTDVACANACTIAIEMLVNAHSVLSIVVGGRPSTRPMQIIGSTKGSFLWDSGALSYNFLTHWLDQGFEPIDLRQVASTPFQHLEAFGLAHGIKGLNGRNNYRIGEDTETPLQMVYSAADCRT